MVVGFNVANVVLIVLLGIQWFWWRRALKRQYEINKGFFKLVLSTHGRLSLHELEKAYTRNYVAGVDRESIIVQLALIKGARVKDPRWWYPWTHEEYTIEQIEKENEHAGSYRQGQDHNNALSLQRYRDTRTKNYSEDLRRQEIVDLEAKAIALQKVLDRLEEEGH